MAPTQREPEQEQYRGGISQACRIDLLDSGVWAQQWEPQKEVSVFFFLAFSPSSCLSLLYLAAFCKSQQKRAE